jgi:mono/diheme cytochrome c family protein
MEDIINQIDGQVQIIFEKTDGDKTYRDALWFKQEEYDTLTPEQIKRGKRLFNASCGQCHVGDFKCATG